MDDSESSTAEQQSHSSSSSSSSSSIPEEMSSVTTELADELYTLERQTNDGWFEAEITELVAIAEGEQIAMTVRVTSDETVTWHLDKPAVWSEENPFVRLAEQYGYGASSIDLLEGEFLPIRPDTGASGAILDTTGRWEFKDSEQFEPDPEPESSLTATIKEIITDIFAMATVMGIILLLVWVIAVSNVPARLEPRVTQVCILL